MGEIESGTRGAGGAESDLRWSDLFRPLNVVPTPALLALYEAGLLAGVRDDPRPDQLDELVRAFKRF